MNTTTTPRHVRPRLASRALFREAFASLSDAGKALLDALYTLLTIDVPSWINRQDDRFCAFLFADETKEAPVPKDRNVYSKPFETPAHFYDEDGRWNAVPDWIGWLAGIICVAVSAWLFYLWTDLMIGIVAATVVVLLYLTFRKP